MNASFLWSTPHLIPDPQAVSDDAKWELIRAHRNYLLSRCDWTQLPDAALILGEKEAWAAYRQALRNIPENFQLPDDVIFPDEPGDAA